MQKTENPELMLKRTQAKDAKFYIELDTMQDV